jgi:tRNA splicing ligase
VKERYVILSNDHWRFAVNVNLSTYNEVLSTLKSDLLAIEKQRKEFTSISELKQIELFVRILEDKINDFYQILPRPDPRRGLINLGGNILKSIFGTATVSDVHELHSVLDFQNRNSYIIHSLSNQLTYVKKEADTTSLNTESIANLSSIVKDSIIQSHDEYQQNIRDMFWFNLIFLGHATTYTAVRQMEFTLLQLTQKLNEIFEAVQLVISGSLSIQPLFTSEYT